MSHRQSVRALDHGSHNGGETTDPPGSVPARGGNDTGTTHELIVDVEA